MKFYTKVANTEEKNQLISHTLHSLIMRANLWLHLVVSVATVVAWEWILCVALNCDRCCCCWCCCAVVSWGCCCCCRWINDDDDNDDYDDDNYVVVFFLRVWGLHLADRPSGCQNFATAPHKWNTKNHRFEFSKVQVDIKHFSHCSAVHIHLYLMIVVCNLKCVCMRERVPDDNAVAMQISDILKFCQGKFRRLSIIHIRRCSTFVWNARRWGYCEWNFRWGFGLPLHLGDRARAHCHYATLWRNETRSIWYMREICSRRSIKIRSVWQK